MAAPQAPNSEHSHIDFVPHLIFDQVFSRKSPLNIK